MPLGVRQQGKQITETAKQWQPIEAIFHESMKCRKCFVQGLAESAFIDVAQPRWMGPRYFGASVKVLIISLNPGAGNTPEKQRLHVPFRQVLHAYRDGRKTCQDLFAFQRQYIPRWGTPPGRFVRFYMDGMGLTLDEVALANIAWCADAKNKWPGSMLSLCFHLHTGRLVAAIRPDVAILSGSGTHKYATEIERLVPRCRAVCTLHYAHRKNRDAERAELQRVRNEIMSAREKYPQQGT